MWFCPPPPAPQVLAWMVLLLTDRDRHVGVACGQALQAALSTKVGNWGGGMKASMHTLS